MNSNDMLLAINELNSFNEQIKKIIDEGSTIKYKYLYRPESKIDCISIGVDIGSYDEIDIPEYKGISHFLEHMVFNGSKNFTKDEINDRMSFMGGMSNASTSTTHTNYHCTFLSNYLGQAIATIFDIVYSPILDESMVEKERDIILKEYDQGLDNETRTVYANLMRNFNDKRCGLLPIGTREGISNITSEALKDFHRRYYTLSNSVIYIATSRPVEEVNSHLREVVDNLNLDCSGTFTPRKDIFNLSTKESEVKFSKKGKTQSILLSCNVFDKKDSLIAMCLNSILSNGLGARMTKRLREEKQLCYSCGTWTNVIGGNKYGLFTIINYSDSSKTEEIKEDIQNVYTECIDSITEYELRSAKNNLIGSLFNIKYAVDYPIVKVNSIIEGSTKELSEEDILAVTLEDINKFILTYLDNKDKTTYSLFIPE